MPTRSKYEHGMFCWVELATNDPEGAKKFYGGLFDWSFDDAPVGQGMVYTTCKLGGRSAAALYKKGPQMQAVPPHWTSYITVDDVDARTTKAVENGGTISSQPFDVMDIGRMAVIQDPTGASFAFWQPKKHIGAEIGGEPGTLVWNELMTTDAEAARKFYVQTLGWQTEAVDMGPTGIYTLFKRPGASQKEQNLGGMMAMPPHMKGTPSHWLAYFGATSCDRSATKVAELGGRVYLEPTDIPDVGRFAVVQDPEGATFALFETKH